MNNLPNPKDLIKSGAQFAYPIQWRRWEVINVFITQFNWKVGVEIGVNEGETVFEIAKSNPKLKLYGIDPYKVQQENILYERNISQKYNDNSLNIIKRKTLKEAFRYPNLEIIVECTLI